MAIPFRSSFLPQWLPWMAGLLAFLFLLTSAGVVGRSVGYYHDGLWDVIPAVGMIRGDSVAPPHEIRLFHRPFPLVTGPYQGALKTWLIALPLALFGTSPQTVHALTAMLGMIYLLSLYWALLPVVGRKWAWVVFASPFVDTNLLVVAPTDTGPSLFQYIFISLAMGALFRYLTQSDEKHLRWLWIFSGCILAQKLTAIPIVLGFLLVACLLSYLRFRETARSGQMKTALVNCFLIPGVLFILPMIPHLIYFYRSGFGDLFAMTADGARVSYFAALQENFLFFCRMFDGVDWYQRITLESAPDLAQFPWPAILGLAVLTVALLAALVSGENRKHSRYAWVGIGLSLFSFSLYPAFRGLNRPWHIYVLTPLFVGNCVISAHFVGSCLASLHRKFSLALGIVIAGSLIFGLAASTSHGIALLHRLETKKGACITSPAINDAYRAARSANIKFLYSINYSLAYPLYVLSKGTIRVEDLAFVEVTQEKTEQLFEKIRTTPEAGIIYRYCGCKEGDAGWIQWLNRESRLKEFLARVELERESLNIIRCSDPRQTDFVIITKRRGESASGPIF